MRNGLVIMDLSERRSKGRSKMAISVVIEQYGGPNVFQVKETPVPAPGPGEVLIRHMAIGINFIDVYHRTGLYPLPRLPAVIGSEAAGRIEAVGEGVLSFHPGERVAYAGGPTGSYCEYRLIDASRLVPVPDSISDRQAAAVMLKGMTAEYLLRRTYPVKQGDLILFHSAAGGVGSIACQWAKKLGATVIGTVGNRLKAAIAEKNGCDYVILLNEENFPSRVREITGGAGVSVVYDGIGAATFLPSLECLRTRGMMVSYGQSSGVVPPFDITTLSAKGSLYLTRPSLAHYTATPEALRSSASELFRILSEGVKIEIGQTYPLKEAAKAHVELEGRKTVGSSLLLP